MKTGSGRLRSGVLGLCLIVGGAVLARGQIWLPIQGYGGTVGGVVTTGAVTYVQYTWYLGACERVSSMGPIIRNGSNFRYDFSLETEFADGTVCAAYVILEKTNVALGTLSPGAYTLTTTSWNVPIRTNTFTISPALRSLGRDTNGGFQLQLSCGITNVSYILEVSPNLVDWISLSTNSVSSNSVGVRLNDDTLILPGSRYYRVKCP